MKNLMGDLFAEGFYRNIYEVQIATGNADPFAAINTQQVEAIVTRPWSPDGTNFSEKIWKDRNQLVNYLDRELTQSLIRGEGPDRLIRELQDRFNVTSKQAARLVQTEAAYFSTMSKIKSYKEMGFTKYTILAVMDAKTSEICMDMDGEVFDIEDMKVGATAPPFHPNCRTTIAQYEDTGDKAERSPGLLRDPNSGEMYSIPRDMTYKEWEQKYVKDAVENTADMEYNISAELTDDELYAINRYLSAESYVLNEKLRYDTSLSQRDLDLISNLDSALEKMPFYQGDISRSVHLSGSQLDDFINSHQPGMERLYKAYTSFTFGETYNPEARVQIYIADSGSGRNISQHNNAENEVLYPRNTWFAVEHITEKNGCYYIRLKER
jgi:SPP1 gp7 family putative phage head morphogenesis protein